MFQIDLVRVTAHKESPQFGVMLIDGLPKLLTLEPPDLDNKPNESCIPQGRYICKKRISSKTNGARTFEVMDVPNRSAILFHAGNTVKDSEGCILLGLGLGVFNLLPGITRSREAFTLFSALTLDFDEFELFIGHV